ncbi:UNVERIFIED_CONTAM: hypothetical protein FKN15_053625 [Acipenser sinensis]
MEIPSFRHFLSIADSKFSMPSRGNITGKISHMAAEMQQTIRSLLEKADSILVTVDIWTDRKMRGSLGITAHIMDISSHSLSLKSVLLSCDRFTGSHTGERISEKFESMCDNYIIKNKIDYIISDKVANMRKAFTVCFPSSTESNNNISPSEDLDDAEIWEELDDDEAMDMNMSLQSNCRKKLAVLCT